MVNKVTNIGQLIYTNGRDTIQDSEYKSERAGAYGGGERRRYKRAKTRESVEADFGTILLSGALG